MSKKVSILEGQKGSKFSGVKYLRTNLSGGGVCEWVPEDSVKLTTKRITKNGEYLANKEKDSQNNPYYAFSQVTVSVKNSTTGTKDPSTGGDGNEYSVSVDDDGMLTEKVLPSKIKITTLPNKLNYNEGDSIDMLGAVVQAYKKDGSLWVADGYADGIIPLQELTITPSIATTSGGSGGGAMTEDDILTDFDGSPYTIEAEKYNQFHFGYRSGMPWYTDMEPLTSLFTHRIGGEDHYYFNDKYVYIRGSDNNVLFCAVLDNTFGTDGGSFGVSLGHEEEGEWTSYASIFNYSVKSCEFTLESNGKSASFLWSTRNFSKDYLDANFPVDVTPSSVIDNAWNAYLIAYYLRTGGSSGDEVTVTWNRPEDFKPLTDTFDIEVTPSN